MGELYALESTQSRKTFLKKHRHPWIIAHRGARDQAPENTCSALKQALKYAIDGIEFDVQMSSDGEPVLYHDHTLIKVGGGRKRVADLEVADLQEIDWGKWFHRRFSGEPLPTLARALSMVARCPNMCIEIKSHTTDQASGHVNKLTEKIIEHINQPDVKPFKNHLLILSFDPNVLARAYKMDPEVRYVLNLPADWQPDKIPASQHLWAVDVRISKLSPSLTHWAHRHNLKLFTYTCNGPRQVNKALNLGVDAIITDRPAWLVKFLGRR